MDNLLPCPFCGSSALIMGYGGNQRRARCAAKSCAAFGPKANTDEEAAKKWNSSAFKK